jgi:Domain of unknown function (DUF5664)
MSRLYCDRHGHERGNGSNLCNNCGDDLGPLPPLPIEATKFLDSREDVPPPPTDNMGDGMPNTKPSNPINPKDAIGAGKLPMHLVPTAVARYASLGFAEGALKYGKYNWRVAGVRMSIYLDAIHRHLAKLQDGEWADGDSLGPDENGDPQGTQVPHLASLICCAGIILDAYEVGKLTDDRPPINATASATTDGMAEHVAYLKALFAKYSPHQHVITDAARKD